MANYRLLLGVLLTKLRAMDFDKVIGIDPGNNGGIAVFNNGYIGTSKMPLHKVKRGNKVYNETDVAAIQKILQEQTENHKPIIFIEHVQAFGSEQGNIGKMYRIQKMLANYEGLISVLKLSRVPYIQVPPRTWQSYLNLTGDRKETSTERKSRYARFAKKYYPMANVRKWNSDAICLVHFGRAKLKFDTDYVRDSFKESEQLHLL